MRKFLVIIIFITCHNSLLAQTEKTIDKKGRSIYYGNFVKEIKSEKDLPKNIQFILKGYLNKIFPSIIDSITFSHGQIIDLKKLFQEDPITYKRFKIIPKYELTFYLKYKPIGIQNYNFEIGLDEYGQILETNWPKEIVDFSNFISLTEIENIALKHAKEKKIDYKSYEVDLIYKKDIDELFWIIHLLIKEERGRSELYTIEIPRNSRKNINEVVAYRKVVY